MASVPTREELEAENRDLREALRFYPELFTKLYEARAIQALKSTVMFSGATEEELRELAKTMERVEFKAGSMMVREDCEMNDAFVIYSGDVRRWVTESGKTMVVNTYCNKSIGLLHFYNRADKSRFNAECVTDVVAFRLKRESLDKVMEKNPHLAHSIIRDLSFYIRSSTSKGHTPLTEQKSYRVSFLATSFAAFVESFYRSFMNNFINQAITGQKGPWFPHMHVQAPVRIVYVNGLKQIRGFLDTVDLSGNPNAWLYRMLFTMVPGVVMCPFSSVLEASNAHVNKEPLHLRWMRGFAPRLAREILFAIGMNQLADYFTERSRVENPHLRNAVGSISAGVCSGYFSHMPHILSTKKLYEPQKSYKVLFDDVWKSQLHRVPEIFPESAKPAVAKVMAVAFPVGVIRRSLQISGTFIVINGIIYVLRDKNWP